MFSFPRNLWTSFVGPVHEPVHESPYDPSGKDVLHVKGLLHNISTLPLELIDQIIDLAEYWPHTTTTTPFAIRVAKGPNENKFVLRSLPLGFGTASGADFQTLSEDKGPYKSANPHPYQDPSQVQQDISERVIDQAKSTFRARGEHPCRKIVFTLKSHDQGWGGDPRHKGTYNGSFTWFDVGLERLSAFYKDDSRSAPHPQFYLADAAPEVCKGLDAAGTNANQIVFGLRTVLPHTTSRENAETHETMYQFEHPLLPDEMALQKNLTAVRDTTKHIVTWSFNDHIDPESPEANELQQQGRGSATGSGELVRSLEVGDVITVWAKSRFPGWMNVVVEASIDVYWAI